MKILTVNAADVGGGAEKIAHTLWSRFREAGHDSWFVVGERCGPLHPDIFELPNLQMRNPIARMLYRMEAASSHSNSARAAHLAGRLAEPRRLLSTLRGLEDFDHPGTAQLLDVIPSIPDVIHLHNLHGRYFDLRWLPQISRAIPTVMTLHDEWVFTGHCAYSWGCERWRTGCGQCPDLNRYPSVRRDATDTNWQRKKARYHAARLFVAAPSRWLSQRAQESMLDAETIQIRHIPNGVDTGVFRPMDRAALRAKWDLPRDAFVIAVDAKTSRGYRDHRTALTALQYLLQRHPERPWLFLCFGVDQPPPDCQGPCWHSTGFITDEKTMAERLACADAYVHTTHADNFPNTVLEAMACGTPAVATHVGGIPEQILDGVDGFLVPHAEHEAVAHALERLFVDPAAAKQMGARAAHKVAERFHMGAMVDAYQAWFSEICDGVEL
jgi:glycosyltransferase involved in cell wall biosynthesis